MNLKVEKNRIYHPWHEWEDYKCNFYDNCTGQEKESKLQSAVKMFNSDIDTERCMNYVMENWTNSMEHNLTNNSLNQIAYIGQSACAYYDNVPATITMEAWSLLTDEVKERSNQLAQGVIDKWNKKNKFIQRCLNLD